MIHWKGHSFVLLAAFAPLVLACSSDESGDDDSGRGGSNAGGTGGSQGGAGGASGTAGAGAGGAPLVDCTGLCNRVRMTCEGQSTIDDTWVDVCTRACEIRVEVAPETALLEKACIEGTTDCTTAILCVSMPTATGGSTG